MSRPDGAPLATGRRGAAVLCTLALALGACTTLDDSGPPVQEAWVQDIQRETGAVTDDDIERAERRGELASLYQRIASGELNVGSEQKRQRLLEAIGARLAERRVGEVRSALGEAQLDSGLYPLPALERALERLAPVEQWAAGRHAAIHGELTDARAASEAALSRLRDRIAGLPRGDHEGRLGLLARASRLAGEDSEAARRYRRARQRAAAGETAPSRRETAPEGAGEDTGVAGDADTATTGRQAASARTPEDTGIAVQVARFDATDGTDAVARRIRAGAMAHLTRSPPSGLRLVAADNGADARPALRVSGEVLEARVDTEVEEAERSREVVTGRETRLNPDWEKWRANGRVGEEPAKTVEVPVRQTVTYGVSLHRKMGVISVAYRVTDTASGEVAAADTITVEERARDTGTEGVEVGDFNQPFELAELPLDIEILNELAERVATRMGRRLDDFLQER